MNDSLFRYAGLRNVENTGLSVQLAATRLHHLSFVEKKLMFFCVAHLVGTPMRHLKLLLGRAQFLAAERCTALRRRLQDTVCVVDSVIYSNGGEIIDGKGKCALDQPPAIEALEYLKSLQAYSPTGILNAASEDMRQLFLNGSLAIEFWPALEQPSLQKSTIDWDFVAGHSPDGKKPVGTYGGWNLVLYKQSKQKDAAWKFIRFLTRPDVNGSVVDLLPANVTAAKEFLAKNRKNPELQTTRSRVISMSRRFHK
jgi:Bacterial extracellular solute-binding protein